MLVNHFLYALFVSTNHRVYLETFFKFFFVDNCHTLKNVFLVHGFGNVLIFERWVWRLFEQAIFSCALVTGILQRMSECVRLCSWFIVSIFHVIQLNLLKSALFWKLALVMWTFVLPQFVLTFIYLFKLWHNRAVSLLHRCFWVVDIFFALILKFIIVLLVQVLPCSRTLFFQCLSPWDLSRSL